MKIRENIKKAQEGPIQAIKIAVIALFVAITALIVSLGKRAGNG